MNFMKFFTKRRKLKKTETNNGVGFKALGGKVLDDTPSPPFTDH